MESNSMKLESSENSATNEAQVLETSQLVDSNQNNGLASNQLATSGIQLVHGGNQAWNNSLQMMLLPSAVGSSNFLNNTNLITLQDGHLLVTPVSESGQQDSNLLAQQLLLQQQLQQTQPHLLSHKVETDLNQPQRLLESQASLQQTVVQKCEKPKLPKKPLNTYMMFSKAIWPQVKAANSHLSSVTEIGAIVGAIWRDLDASQKQQYNEYFIKDKERYENELREYRQMTGLSESDSIRPPNKKRCKDTRAPSTWQASNQQTSTQQTSSNQQQTSSTQLVLSSSTAESLRMPADSSEVTQLPQTGLSSAGQLLLNDGNIDNNLVNMLAQHSQSLLPQNNTSGDKQVDNLVSNLIGADQNSWLWQQSKLDGTVDCLQQSSDLFKDSATTLYYDEQQKQFYLKNESGVSALITGIDPTTGMVSLDPTSTPVLSKEQLEAELQQLRSALSERTSQVQVLTTRLEEAKQIIEHYQQQMQQITAVADDSQLNGNMATSSGADHTSNVSASSPSTTPTSTNLQPH